MATIEITENTVIRSLIRKGTNSERQQVTLLSGELGFTTDAGQRLYIGDGQTPGGIIAGNKYLGDTNTTSLVTLQPQPGDLVKSGLNLYARNPDGSGNPNEISTGYTKIGNTANIDGNGLTVDGSDTLNVAVDDSTIEIQNDILQVKEVPYDKLSTIPSFSILSNRSDTAETPEGVAINNNSLLGRINANALNNVTFNEVLENANAPTLNGNVTISTLKGTGTRIVQANSSGVLETVGGTGFINFLTTPIVIYNPPNSKQGTTNWENYTNYLSNISRTTLQNNKFLTYPGDATLLANASNVILEVIILATTASNYSFNVSTRTATGQGTNSMGYNLGYNEADNSKDRGHSITQGIVPCNADGAFEFNVNTTNGSRLGYPVPSGTNRAWGTANGGVIIRLVGYTL